MQLKLLRNFMQYDMEADKFESEMRASPNRQKLLKQRDFLLEQQSNIKRIEADVAEMGDRLEAVQDEADRLNGLLTSQLEAMEKQQPETLDEIQAQAAALQKLESALTRYEQELAKMRKDGETRDRQQKDIRLRAARTKAEFDKLKGEYDAEFKTDSAKLKALKERAGREAQPIDEQVLARYRQIKQHVTPPMAPLNGDRCGGCNMSLPAATRSQIHAGEVLVECDNCGRILYTPDEG
ncbi:MAG: hypothetical protein GX558_03540 [Clostridiales bacterium]|nr:hypothetical protein [Clostridiales bacterium]